MSVQINSIVVGGNLTRDPELRYTPSGTALLNMSIANNSVRVNNGEQKKETSFFSVDVWARMAENCHKYLKKGSPVLIEGRVKQDTWEKDGQKKEKIKIIANRVHFLYSANHQSNSEQQEVSWDD